MSTMKQLMDQLEDSQQHFDKTVQAALSDALFSTLYPLGQLFSQEKAILFLNFASQSDLAFHHNVYKIMTPQCVNIRYPYNERSTPSISKILQNPVVKERDWKHITCTNVFNRACVSPSYLRFFNVIHC